MTTVVDASAFLDAILPGTRQRSALGALAGRTLFAPGLIDLEVLSVLWRLARTGQISTQEAARGVKALREIPMTRVPLELLAESTWRLREGLRISDAFYVAAARSLGAPLVTSDARLAGAPNLNVTVTVVR